MNRQPLLHRSIAASLLRRDCARLVLLFGLLAPFRQAAGQVSPCSSLDTTAAWAQANRAWSNETGVRWSNDSLRRVLLALRDRDQTARAEFGARVGDTLYGRQLMRLDSTLATELTVILDRFGVPTRSMVGPAGQDAAMRSSSTVGHCRSVCWPWRR